MRRFVARGIWTDAALLIVSTTAGTFTSGERGVLLKKTVAVSLLVSLLLQMSFTIKETTAMVPILVIFGRPGAGKTTVAEASASLLQQNGIAAQCIDLDVCVPQWMKDNFAQGIYPTLSERNVFANEACSYVSRQLEETQPDVSLVSFSFVNADLRNVFRNKFPGAVWALIDTPENEAQVRIEQRSGHFYKGKVGTNAGTKPKDSTNNDANNSDWNFAPVTFPHEILNGENTVKENAENVQHIFLSKFHNADSLLK